jgi:hypothetical protein
MSDTRLSDRQLKILRVVAEGAGDWNARRIDITVDSRYGPGSMSVLRELQELERLGFITHDNSRSGVGGRWAIADITRSHLE